MGMVVLKAFSYLRVSGKGQIDGDGFPRQRECIVTYAIAGAIEIEQEFLDKGVSGKREGADRPGLNDLYTAIRANGVRLVLVENADRLARDLLVGELILAEFRELGVKVVAADSGTDLTVADDDPTRKLVRQILGAIAEFEKVRIVHKLRAARMRTKKQNGRCEGKKPYGVTVQEYETLAKMSDYRTQGLTFDAVASRLNDEGLKPRTGEKWYAATVRRIINRTTVQSA